MVKMGWLLISIGLLAASGIIFCIRLFKHARDIAKSNRYGNQLKKMYYEKSKRPSRTT